MGAGSRSGGRFLIRVVALIVTSGFGCKQHRDASTHSRAARTDRTVAQASTDASPHAIAPRPDVARIAVPESEPIELPTTCAGLCERARLCGRPDAAGCAAQCASATVTASVARERWMCANAPCAAFDACRTSRIDPGNDDRWSIGFTFLPGGESRLVPAFSSFGDVAMNYPAGPVAVSHWLRAAARADGWTVSSVDRDEIRFTREGRTVIVTVIPGNGTFLRTRDEPELPPVRRLRPYPPEADSFELGRAIGGRIANTVAWRRCDPAPAAGDAGAVEHLTIRYTIDASGRVTTTSVVEARTRELRTVALCLASAVRGVSFASRPGESNVVVDQRFDVSSGRRD